MKPRSFGENERARSNADTARWLLQRKNNEMPVNPVRANCIVLSAAAFPSPLQSPATTETAFFASRLASAYSKLRHIQLARELFDGILHPWVCGPNEVRILFSSGDFRLELSVAASTCSYRYVHTQVFMSQ
ncbi:hypothetical protein B296_00019973 [Ensete ventricosum]|uniref:Uncharacterized protein n=1 Tax=Ensete ventricosum TaxID=4639 RepID=A0A427A712_ENSVE|nr:hypothetical protein B296_00019973 [Ensete ventricosum]